jgi:anti-anti-sigma regulatory factor
MPGVGNTVDLAGSRLPECCVIVSAGAESSVRLVAVRVIGPVESPRGFGLQDHLCWVHGDGGDYRPRLTEFFSEGLERGLQVAFLGAGNVEELREHLDRFIDVGPLLTREALRIISFDEIYRAGEPVDPAEVMKKYAAATQEALAGGYRGLRISADVTDLVRAPEQQGAFARFEFLLERYSSQHPLSALCQYRLELGDAVTQFACMHAAVPAGLTPFQVFACDDGAVGLLGDFDAACQAGFTRALQSIQPAPDDSELVFDMSAVRFMDHRALLALDSYAQECQAPVRVRSMPPVVRRVARVLGLEHLGSVRTGGL